MKIAEQSPKSTSTQLISPHLANLRSAIVDFSEAEHQLAATVANAEPEILARLRDNGAHPGELKCNITVFEDDGTSWICFVARPWVRPWKNYGDDILPVEVFYTTTCGGSITIDDYALNLAGSDEGAALLKKRTEEREAQTAREEAESAARRAAAYYETPGGIADKNLSAIKQLVGGLKQAGVDDVALDKILDLSSEIGACAVPF